MPEISVILHNIRSLYNVASVFRTADAAGVRKIYLCGITPAPADRFGKLRPQFAKVALGAEKYVQWEKCASAARLVKKLKQDGWKIFAVEQNKKSVPYHKISKFYILNSKFCLIFGSEIRGLAPSVLRQADKILEIPMRGALLRQARHPRRSGEGKESLNVAVAFGVVVFELLVVKQKRRS